ncbi:extracellular solute-binding protein [Allonocardiopsis opalescens]|uniref:Carbohydrate ABC transporter substrate-binding protein (CUT1 family) n=1 Tax=Allonocardiopsis opalescens TaxID=1144618 RepID=A0A2T0PXE5_9ACTN|nr:extracellular solute-binding protein [Allonocardiopsis opalescens]PRX96108.1 carbohydrate ABC transporter substrate-binding protein (CUT1 family) [Allonocardiopsis opalescens]
MHDTTGPPRRPGPYPLSRRTLLAGSLAAAGLGLAGCGSVADAASGRRALRQWNLFTGGDGARMVEMHDLYRREHPEIELRPTTYLWGIPYYTKFLMGAAGGRACDIATIHLSRLRGLGIDRLIDPVPTDLLAEYGVTEQTVLPNIWNNCLVDGRLYAIPLDTHLIVTYYNRTICEQAGVLDSDGRLIETTGTEDFTEMLRAVRDVTGQVGVSLDTYGAWNLFWSLYRQAGGDMSFDGGQVTMDDDRALEVLDFLRRLAEEGLAPTDSNGPATAANFTNEVAGLCIQGNWEVATFETAGLDFGMRPLQGIFGEPLTRGDSHAFVLPHRRTPDDAAVRAAVEYAAWMLQHSITWAGGGHVPAYLPVTEDPAYLDLRPQSDYRDAVRDAQFDPDAWFSGSAAPLQNDAASIFSGVFSGATTPEQALARFRQAAQQLVDTPSPV